MMLIFILIAILNIQIVNAYSPVDRLLASFPNDPNNSQMIRDLQHIHIINKDDIRLPSIMDVLIGQLSSIHVIRDNHHNHNDKIVDTLFLVMSYSSYSHSLLVLTKDENYYMVDFKKMYYVSKENYSLINQTHKFLYYEMMDKFSKITLEDVQYYMTET
jgi:hypothetical protein